MSAGEPSIEARTTAHYDRHPLEFMTEADERDPVAVQPPPFVWFVENLVPPGAQVAEIGCGPGRGTMYLAARELLVVALDISQESIRLARRRAPAARFVCGTNLALPFANASFDAVVSDGVVHHTPDAHRSFGELVRILRPGGALYLGIYNRRRYYYYLYTYLGAPARWLERRRLGRALVRATLLPAYYAIHLIKSRGRRSRRGAENFFYDYLLTPRASFHTREEVLSWACAEGLDLVSYDASLGNVHVFMLSKPRVGPPAGRASAS